MLTWKDRLRLRDETEALIKKVNRFQDFTRTNEFYKLDRQRKDLLYAQLHAMLDYLQILGKRCELENIVLSVKQNEE